jgi:DNA-binding MarR family transcriptional regulator
MTSQVLTTQASPATIAAFARLLRTHAAVTRDLSAKLVADHGLTINDYEALLHLSHAEEGALRRVDLAEKLVLTPSGVTRLLDGLERTGCVEKGSCESDARVTYAVLTKEGRDKLEAASRSHIAQVSALFEERFSREELETLAALLGRLPGGGGGNDEECSPGS